MSGIPEFMCPLCGHYHSTKHYEPEKLPLDILGVSKVGLGRGNGTRVLGTYSILDTDDATSFKIIGRVFVLCKLFLDRGKVSEDEVRRKLGFGTSQVVVNARVANKHVEDIEALRVQVETSDSNARREKARADKLQGLVESLDKKVVNLQFQLSEEMAKESILRRDVEEYEAAFEDSNEILDDVIGLIEGRTSEIFDISDSNDSREAFIYDSVKKILEDLEALKAEQEDE